MDYLLVHGAWHGAWVWAGVGARLRSAGHRVHAVDLPSHGAPGTPIGGLYDDVEAVRAALADLRRPVVLVGHSYGGAVITEAAAGQENVCHLAYIAAFMPDTGQSILDTVGGNPPFWWRVSADGTTVTPDQPKGLFYNDCDDATADAAVAKLLPQSYASLSQPVRAAAWHDIPSTYLVTLRDQVGSPEIQRIIGSVADKMLDIDTGHSPMLSKPGVLAEMLEFLAA